MSEQADVKVFFFRFRRGRKRKKQEDEKTDRNSDGGLSRPQSDCTKSLKSDVIYLNFLVTNVRLVSVRTTGSWSERNFTKTQSGNGDVNVTGSRDRQFISIRAKYL